MISSLIKKTIDRCFGKGAYFKLRWFLKHGFAYLPIACYFEVEGWLEEKEAKLIYDTVLRLPDNGAVALELGSLAGKSSIVIAKGLRKKNNPRLFCIDPLNGTGDCLFKVDYLQLKEKLQRSLEEEFLENIKKCRVQNLITLLKGRSSDFVSGWASRIDLLYIDADHSYEAVAFDFISWSKFLVPGGFIIFHDAKKDDLKNKTYNGGPYRVIQEQILDSAAWSEKKFDGEIFIARKVK